uniref:Uncharacterized protein n=1 Tax=Eptatretus burgeri TaxID=7764 RepID=A0A8C4PX57_EPTBU
MESQGEREPGVLEMDVECVKSMVQDRNPEQEMLVVQDELSPQLNPELEMGAVAGVADERPPRANSPMDRTMEMFEALMSKMDGNAHEMKENAQQLKDEMKTNMETNAQRMKEEMEKMRGEMQNMGRRRQAGTARMLAITGELKLATPRVGANELGGSATVVRPTVKAGEGKMIRGTCWARSVEVTEEVTVTEREELNGVAEVCGMRNEVTTKEIKIVETREITREETEIIETREMGTVEERLHDELDGVEDEHTHTQI